MMERTGLGQANTSQHFQTLTDSGILGWRKEGLRVIYFVEDPGIVTLCVYVRGSIQHRHASHAAVQAPVVGKTRTTGTRG